MGVFDVPAGTLIRVVAEDLKKQGIERPAWALFVKTGPHKERSPDNPDWFFERAASVLYRIYKEGPLGTESLRTYYGGKKRRGTKRPEFRKASGKVIRSCLQALEKQGLVKKGKKGRVVTGKGQSYLNRKSKEAVARAAEEKERPKERREEKKSEQEKRVEEALKKQEEMQRAKEKAKEEKKKEKHKEEKKPEEA